VTRRLAAALAVSLALIASSPVPGLAQRIPPPELTLTPKALDFASSLWDVSFADPEHGHAVGAYHSVFRTTDGGETWERQNDPFPRRDPVPYDHEHHDATDPTNGAYMGASFVDPEHGALVSNDGHVIVTSDGGATWQVKATPAPATIGDVGYPGKVVPKGWSFRDVSFVDRDHGYVVGADGVILATADGGTTWTTGASPNTVP
jgi:photosystem II stability/assembly factor-like uncharacterized protein